MATIREVANHAGVSIGTVSNVLNGRLGSVSQDTRERVLASIRDLGYRPTAFEPNQKATRTQNLALIVPDLVERPLAQNRYIRETLDGVLEGATRRGWSVTIFAETIWNEEGNAVRRKYDGRCDALIIAAPQPKHDVVSPLAGRGTPIVQVGTTPWVDRVSSIDINNVSAGNMVGTHFKDLGHRQIAFVGDDENQVSARERLQGFREIFPTAASFTVGREMSPAALATVLREMGPSRPSALWAWHDEAAFDLIRALEEEGLNVPGAVSVAGVNGSVEMASNGLRLTSIDNPFFLIGRRAAEMAISRTREPTMPREIIKLVPQLMAGETTSKVSD